MSMAWAGAKRAGTVAEHYTIRRLKVGRADQMDALAQAAGELYSRTLISFWRTVRRKGVWLKASSSMRWHNSNALHAHSADAVVQAFYASLQSWRARRKADPDARPPRRRKRYFKLQWKSSAIRVLNGQLMLSNGKGNEPLRVPWKWRPPRLVEMGWDGQQYELRATYTEPVQATAFGIGVAGVDLGEVHPAVAHDGGQCVIANGRLLRSKRRYQNKLKAQLDHLIDAKQRGSRRWQKLVRSKRRQLRKLNNQIRDILHKETTAMISTLHASGVQTVVIGDVRDIRQGLNYGHTANQKIHQMLHGQTRHMLTYKAERLGMRVILQNEAYTSQTCPACGRRHKPSGREYRCSCGFQYHRDGVGAYNIRAKYMGSGPVVGAMASPTGMRFTPHMRCSSARLDRKRIPRL
jgi:putative transposase